MKNKKSNNLYLFLTILVVGIFTIQACQTYYFRSSYKEVNNLIHETKNLETKPYLKAHLKNGEVCILKDSWSLDTIKNNVSGNGISYDFNRTKISEGEVSINIDSVAIFETNKKLVETEKGRMAAISILAGLDAILGIVCLTNPKMCFGSCPTFYINENDNFHYADAEGFSNAIFPSMEYLDIDALNNEPITDHNFSITMKNEALETHCVNKVKLLAYPRNEGERVYQSPNDEFYLCENKYKPSTTNGPEGDITALISKDDKQERFSLADEHNLSSKEEIYLEFNDLKKSNDLGLVMDFRQTLMTTYFIYNAMDYMGDQVGDFFAKMETNTQTRHQLKNGITKELGNIDIYKWNEQIDDWELQNGFFETGPIAFNRQILPLTKVTSGSTVKLKLVLNKGLWRINYLALTNIKQKVEPIELNPTAILNKGKLDKRALTQINSLDNHLISMPGSEYKFNFILPNENQDYELFLGSKGYYLEWMRKDWLKDKNLSKLRQMVENPKKYLSTEAQNYKLYETTMEQEFWDSKIDTKTFSYHEN